MAVQSAAEVDRAVSSTPGGPVGGFVISDQPILGSPSGGFLIEGSVVVQHGRRRLEACR